MIQASPYKTDFLFYSNSLIPFYYSRWAPHTLNCPFLHTLIEYLILVWKVSRSNHYPGKNASAEVVHTSQKILIFHSQRLNYVKAITKLKKCSLIMLNNDYMAAFSSSFPPSNFGVAITYIACAHQADSLLTQLGAKHFPVISGTKGWAGCLVSGTRHVSPHLIFTKPEHKPYFLLCLFPRHKAM